MATHLITFPIDSVVWMERRSSGRIKAEGFKWVAEVVDCRSYVETNLICQPTSGHRDGDKWKCKADVEFSCGILSYKRFNAQIFSDGHGTLNIGSINVRLFLQEILHEGITVRCSIRIHPSERVVSVDAARFLLPSSTSNGALVIKGKKLHISKEYLSIHSPVFEAMFTGNIAEKNTTEVELKGIVYEQFLDLLHVIYPSRGPKLTHATVLHVLALADRFQMKGALDLAEGFLLASDSSDFSTAKKMAMADQFRLPALKEACLFSLADAKHVDALMLTPEYKNFSDEMKAAIAKHKKLLN